jgi:ligand-binding sensor domain-containing protein
VIAHGAGASYYSYEDEEWTNYEYVEEPGEGIYNGGATVITVDGKGRVWFGGYYGLSVMDGDEFTYYDLLTDEERADEDSPRTVYALLFDGTYVWVGTYDTLFRFDENDEVTTWTDDLPGVSGIYSAGANAMAQDLDGSPLLAVGSKLVRYDAEGDKFKEVYEADSEIYSIFVAADETLWLGLYDGGVALYEDDEWVTVFASDGLPPIALKGTRASWWTAPVRSGSLPARVAWRVTCLKRRATRLGIPFLDVSSAQATCALEIFIFAV